MARARQAAHNAPAVVPPQGRLTLTTGTPVMTTEAASQTTLYYTPYVGDRVPLYNGTEWENKLFTELSIAMASSANWATDSNFDVFVYNDAGTLRLVTGAAWTNGTTRAEALVRTNGIWLNNASFTGRYGASSTVSIAASRATYVGTIRTSAAGTTTWELGGTAAGGDPVRLFVWNAYNRVLTSGISVDSTATWTYSTASWRSANASTSNRATYVVGLAEDRVHAVYSTNFYSTVLFSYAALGVDSTTAPSGATDVVVTPGTDSVSTQAIYLGTPGLGLHYIQALEYGSASGTGKVVRGAAEAVIFKGMF